MPRQDERPPKKRRRRRDPGAEVEIRSCGTTFRKLSIGSSSAIQKDGPLEELGTGDTGAAPLVVTGDFMSGAPAINGETTGQLEAEANAALAGAPPEALDSPVSSGGDLVLGPVQESHVEEWRVFMGHTVGVVSVVALPQWELTDGERRELAESLAGCLDQMFPGGLDGKYACWFRLVAAAGGIAVVRIASNGGKLPGFGPRRKSDTDTAAAGEPPAAATAL